MVDQSHHRILVLGYREANITFLNRLLRGLTQNGCEILIASSWCERGKSSSKNFQFFLWTPSIKGWCFGKWVCLIFSYLSSIATKRSGWLKTQINQGRRLKDKLGIFIRYAPFCRDAFDVIYFPWNSTAIAYRGLFELDIPTVVSCRGTQINISPHLPGQCAYVSALRDTLQKASAVHCVSENILHSVVDLGVKQENYVIIRPAVDPEFFTPPSQLPKNRRFTIVTTGSLIWRKSIETLLVALKQLLELGVDAELHIIGDGPERQHILFTINDLGIENRVFLHGRLKPYQVRDQLQKSDSFVLSSVSEGIANAVLEAMSCGLPVITTNCGGMREVVNDSLQGFIVPLRDPQSLAQALNKLASNPDLRQQMGTAGRRRILQDFVLDDQITAFINLFEDALNPETKTKINNANGS